MQSFVAVTINMEIENLRRNTYSEFEEVFKNVLSKHAPIKTKMSRSKNKLFMTKNSRKEFMKISKLQNCFNKK